MDIGQHCMNSKTWIYLSSEWYLYLYSECGRESYKLLSHYFHIIPDGNRKPEWRIGYGDKAVCWEVRISDPSRDKKFFFSRKVLDLFWSPTSLLCSGYQGFFPRGKTAGAKDNHSPRSTTEVKNGCSCTSSPPIRLHFADKENFTFVCTFTGVIDWLYFKQLY